MFDSKVPGNSPSGPSPSFAPDHAEETLAAEMDNIVPSFGGHRQPVVGLGGSAGALGALKTFFEIMPPDTGLTFVVVTHLSPDHDSLMAEILQLCTVMPVVQVTGRVKAEENRVYVTLLQSISS